MPSLYAPILTITVANRREFAGHVGVASALGTDLVLAASDRSWEPGMDKHTNGSALKYFPKGERFRQVAEVGVTSVHYPLNTCWRKVLCYKTLPEASPESRLHRQGLLRTTLWRERFQRKWAPDTVIRDPGELRSSSARQALRLPGQPNYAPARWGYRR